MRKVATAYVECPYCGVEGGVNSDDGYAYEEDELREQECKECDKRFVYRIVVVYHCYALKADCLNGSLHNYVKARTHPPEFARLQCSMCGDYKSTV